MRSLLPVFAAAMMILTGPAIAQSGGVVAAPDLSPNPSPRIMQAMGELYGRTLTVIKRDFPADYPDLVTAFATLEWTGNRANVDRALLAAAEAIKSVRQKYADKLLFAPSVSHAVMLGFLADFYDAVFKGEGPRTCGRFARDGSAVLFQLGLAAKYARQLDVQSVAYFDSVVKAIEEPNDNGVAGPADWEMVGGAMLASGMPPSYLETIAKGDPADPDLCPALAAIFRTSGLLDTPEGARVRADFARNLAGY
jgi:hypothetical protein